MSLSDQVRRPRRGEVIETAVIVGLASLVVIKGGAAVSGILLGIGQVTAAVVSVLLSGS